MCFVLSHNISTHRREDSTSKYNTKSTVTIALALALILAIGYWALPQILGELSTFVAMASVLICPLSMLFMMRGMQTPSMGRGSLVRRGKKRLLVQPSDGVTQGRCGMNGLRAESLRSAGSTCRTERQRKCPCNIHCNYPIATSGRFKAY
ncbi:DUF2933 domain-containing protein [Caballeronia sp. LZ025]|uniref:DUF2933 domain-containing protein n=1 Tax=Caballeronia TaxID=1827195 RepID=UPI001FD2BAA4|nr:MULTISPECIES: DUF2933 domain-containing protein [Caballeronia]MDR5736023.1 DUF2933 domain-containing protein [Caballeronia sp. LZ025]MDR5883823.1 DUF2933 domain-containing protein [Caballeronia sp. LZ032]